MKTILRPYQEECKQKIYDAWDTGHKNVLLVKPTGMGKTRTFCSIAIDMALDPSGPKLPTAISVHRKELVQQISLTLAEEGITHNIIAPREVIKGVISSQRQLFKQQFYNYESPISVVSVDTLNARIHKHEKWAKSIRLWITDEAAHLLASNKWGKACGYFPNAIGLGVTATPQRLDKRGLGRHADGVFDIMVEGPTVRWGIENGFLCNYKIAVPKGDYQQYLKKASDGSDYSKEAMAAASSQSHIVGDIVENYLKFASGKQAIVFSDTIETGRRTEQEFHQAGVSAKLLTGMTPDGERLQSLIEYREKKIKVLLNVDLFDEGLDVPGIECVIHGRPTMSLGKYLQMNGRGLRPAPGKDHLLIIDHVGNVQQHGLPDRPRVWTLDRIVKRRDTVNLLRICTNEKCNAPYDRALDLCPWCGEPAIPSRSGGGGGGRVSPAQVDGDLELLDPETLRAMYEGATLEDPARLAERVSAVAGTGAGIKAMRNQEARIKTQKELSEIIALWAGFQRKHGYSDRQIHKIFYLHFDKTITVALSEPRADMLLTMEELKGMYR
jgi:superfamily II DNA or RNA helicase